MPTIEQLVAFCILMENGQGILAKSPDYIEEKFKACTDNKDSFDARALLDQSNGLKYINYFQIWR